MINLEDIKAPDCFLVEELCKKQMNIPVFHDDQHGTAIITLAALINALDVSKKKINEVKVVVNGAGASAQACTNLFNKVEICKYAKYEYLKSGLNFNSFFTSILKYLEGLWTYFEPILELNNY